MFHALSNPPETSRLFSRRSAPVRAGPIPLRNVPLLRTVHCAFRAKRLFY